MNARAAGEVLTRAPENVDATGAKLVRVDPDRFRECHDLFLRALHLGPTSDARWEQVRDYFTPGLVYGVRGGAADPDAPLLGTVMSVPLEMALPDGDVLPVYGGTFGGVRPGMAGKGLLHLMNRARFDDMREQGISISVGKPAAANRWSQMGMGAATRAQSLRIDRRRSGLRDGLVGRDNARPVPPGTDLLQLLPPIQRRAALGRPGTVLRSAAWWKAWNPYAHVPGAVHAAIAGPPDTPDGYVTWYVQYEGKELAETRRILHVVELHAASAATAADLWMYLLKLELVEEIRATGRPLDEEVPFLLTDQRACRVRSVVDDLWLHLIDVPAALNARGWGATDGEAVLLEVIDKGLPDNSGLYRISSDGAERLGSGTPELVCAEAQLANLYLGDRRPSQLAALGLIRVYDPSALGRADRLFATEIAPWGGTMF